MDKSFNERWYFFGKPSGWIITEQQAKDIKANDINAINNFFNDNIKLLKHYLYKYYYNSPLCDNALLIEVINQMYCDLPYLDYSSCPSFISSLKHSFFFFQYGGYSYLRENNNKVIGHTKLSKPRVDYILYSTVNDSDTYLIDFIADKSELYVYPSNDFDLHKKLVLRALEPYFIGHSRLSKNTKLVISYIMDGYSHNEISKILNCSCTLVNNVVNNLIENYIEVVDLLVNAGFSSFRDYIGVIPPRYETIVNQRKRHQECNKLSAQRRKELRSSETNAT